MSTSGLGKSPRIIAVLLALSVLGIARPEEPATAAAAQLEDRYPERRIAFPHGVIGLADITYSSPSGFRPLTLDLYLPPAKNGASPVIVFVHGGGWFTGHSRACGAFEDWPRVLASIAQRGYAVASINYRLSGEAASPAAAHDVANALKWVRENATRYSLDARRVGLWGSSAGAQLAAIAGTTCGEAGCVQAVAAWYGIFDLEPMVDVAKPGSTEIRYLGCTAGVCSADQIRLASAIRHVDRSDPPFFLVHGDRDRIVPASQSTNFHAALRASGVESELLMIDGVDHSFIGDTPRDTRRASLRALHDTLEFFDRTLVSADPSRVR